MEADLKKKRYFNLSELERYIYGSAEVIGLFMCRILGIPKKAERYAKLLGKSMQYINFIRDIKEDHDFRRTYLPIEDTLKITGENDIMQLNDTLFVKIIKFHIDRYRAWQKEAEKGFKYLNKNNLIPIKTASDMYMWTADKIYKNPLIIKKQKVKPSKTRILLTGLLNSF